MDCVLILALCFVWHTDAAVYKIDVTTFDPSPLVGSSTKEEYRTYLPWTQNDATFDKIGRLEDTGTGEVGTGHDDPKDDNALVPPGSGFPTGTTTNEVPSGVVSNRLEVIFPSSSQTSRIGVFYSTVSRQGKTLTIPTIKISESADINPLKYTYTVSIGDVANLTVNTSKTNLRWLHNNGDVITKWNDVSSVTIDNVRVADGGIYECYEKDRREEGRHAIMRLIVRECPGPKHGLNCAQNCQTCWSGGICADDDGKCLCQQGFKSTACGHRCEEKGRSNHWGATCDLYCDGNAVKDCGGKLICGPDPLGCSCVAGYMGLDCNEACPGGKFGANCDLDCHCSKCDPAIGCSGPCDDDYGVHHCQGPAVCETGYYGEHCKYHCHCYQGTACDKASGHCSNDECAEGWAGIDCQQALPALYIEPRTMHNEGIMIEVDWDDWDQTVDYGNGPVESYRVYYRENGTDPFTDFEQCDDSNWIPKNLQPETDYDFRVSAWRSVDGNDVEGKLGNVIYGTTRCGAPTKHPNFTSVLVLSSDSVMLEWKLPGDNGWMQCSSLEDFIITYYIPKSEQKTIRLPSTNLTTTIDSLEPCTGYEFQIQATNNNAKGVISPPASAITDNVPPGEVDSLNVTSSSHVSIEVSWMLPQSQCDVTSYVVSYNLTSLDQCIVADEYMSSTTDMTSYRINGLESYSTYEISVQARSGNESGPVEYGNATTDETAPSGIPEELKMSPVDKQHLSCEWLQPQCGQRHGLIVTYDYQFGENITEGNFITGSSPSLKADFTDLSHYHWYEFRVRANTTQGAGPFTLIHVARTPESGPEAPQEITISEVFTKSVEVQWKKPAVLNGVLIMYSLEVTNDENLDKHYVTIEEDLQKDSVTTNATNLSADTLYHFKVQGFTNGGEGTWSDTVNGTTLSDKGPEDPAATAAIVGGVVVVILLIIIVIIFGTVVLRKRQERLDKHQSSPKAMDGLTSPSNINIAFEGDAIGESSDAMEEQEQTPLPQDATVRPKVAVTQAVARPKAAVKPLPPSKPTQHEALNISDLFEYVKTNKTNAPYREFKRIYKTIPEEQQNTLEYSTKSENKPKNRYKNIVTYDHSRVVLKLLDGKPHSDYINASYMDGYDKAKAYIAAQGPKVITINDMWRMIWQEQSRTVVMATSLNEGGRQKCDKYWPDLGRNLTYGEISVSNKKEEDRGQYIIRHLQVSLNHVYANQELPMDEVREIIQLHFISWPDMGVPEYATPVLAFIDEMNRCNPSDAGPIVIHCSAGVGRTGTIITIDTMMKMAQAEGKVDIYNFVLGMRKKRVFMVQTEEQYVFIHDALLEAIFCGDTTVSAPHLVQFCAESASGAPDDNKVLNQYKTLDSMFPPIAEQKYNGGRKPENISKNRYPEIIPPDFARPYLMSDAQSDVNANNYINAAFCHGHKRDNLYLATQVPLPGTVGDIWRMIHDYKCRTIVALNDPDHIDQSCGSYIPTPDDNCITCGGFTVEYREKDNSTHTTGRKLLYYPNKSKKDARRVNFIQYNDWKLDAEFPNSQSSFLELINRTERSTRERNDDDDDSDEEETRIAVICMNGVSRCGVFCAVKSIIDQIKDEQQVNIYRIVKRLKTSRHDMIQTPTQYNFCYETACAYLKMFDTYGNLEL